MWFATHKLSEVLIFLKLLKDILVQKVYMYKL